MTLGERLLEYRTNLKMSQDTLAEKVGVTRQTISKWETDQSMPEFNKIEPLCEIFGITTDVLIKGKEFEKEQEEVLKEEKDYRTEYNQKRSKKKAIFISISVFLYIMGAFSVPYMVESGEYSDGESIMFLGGLWGLATGLLIYFFIANPKKEKIITENKTDENKKNLERFTLMLVALVFLFIYLISSFITEAWDITWILWIVFAIAQVIVKIIFDLKRSKNNGK